MWDEFAAEEYTVWMPWQQIVGALNTWWARAVAVAGILLAIYYGPRKMLETWDWYIDRFIDMPVADIVRRRMIYKPIKNPYAVTALQLDDGSETEFSYTLDDIVRRLGRSKKSVYKSLLRLERRGKIEATADGWRWKS